MADYKLYRLDSSGQILSAPQHFSAADDDAAIAEADVRREGGSAELWQGRRLVQRMRS